VPASAGGGGTGCRPRAPQVEVVPEVGSLDVAAPDRWEVARKAWPLSEGGTSPPPRSAAIPEGGDPEGSGVIGDRRPLVGDVGGRPGQILAVRARGRCPDRTPRWVRPTVRFEPEPALEGVDDGLEALPAPGQLAVTPRPIAPTLVVRSGRTETELLHQALEGRARRSIAIGVDPRRLAAEAAPGAPHRLDLPGPFGHVVGGRKGRALGGGSRTGLPPAISAASFHFGNYVP